MRLGLDGFAIPGPALDPFQTLAWVRDQGLEGYFFGSFLHLTPTLDEGFLHELWREADRLGLYLELGLGTVNPARFARFPNVAALGGDYRRGFERLVRAGAALGCRELRVDLGGEAARFDAAEPWPAQLEATGRFIGALAPLCRDLGCRLDVETHADLTTFELVRLVESVGPDVLGVCLDTANVLCRAEDPLAAARRVAPYVHQTHVKDALLFFDDQGLMRQSRPCGEGCIDWDALLGVLAEHHPDLTLSIEDHKGLFRAFSYDPAWQALHPELSAAELGELVRLARETERRVGRGELQPPDEYEAIPWPEQAMARLCSAIDHLRGVLRRHGL
ncbi:MAG TPA: TIM barrel protein [Chloroflexota bacterium]|jgi:sugar phosphate isomerase/epimerase|nr:TIM barrel protein [Chloroflexota bacterium]